MSRIAKKVVFGLLAAVLFVALLIPGLTCRAGAAENAEADGSVSVQEESASPRIFAHLTLSISGGDGRGNIYATVKNEFTLFPSTVNVVVSLYSSPIASTDYENMQLQATANSNDLNMGTTLTAIANNGGRQLYWYAVAEYQEGGGAWKTIEAGPALYDARGYYISG